jgi:hypothetical protein
MAEARTYAMISNYREIPTEYRPKIPIRDTTLQFSYQFAILTPQLHHFLLTWLYTDSNVTMNLNS